MFAEEKETDLDTSDKAHLKPLESNLLRSNKREHKQILFEIMTKYANHVNLPSITRSWVQLCLLNNGTGFGRLKSGQIV